MSYLSYQRLRSRLKIPDKNIKGCGNPYRCLRFGMKDVSPTFLKIFFFIVHKEGRTVALTSDSFLLNSLTSFTSSSVYIDIILPPDLCKDCVKFSN